LHTACARGLLTQVDNRTNIALDHIAQCRVVARVVGAFHLVQFPLRHTIAILPLSLA
jgi:hypothetical protein